MEIKRFNPKLTVGIYYGTTRSLEEVLDSQVILTTYGTVRNDVEKFSKLDFEIVVLDESQNIKNINSQSTKAVMLLNTQHERCRIHQRVGGDAVLGERGQMNR